MVDEQHDDLAAQFVALNGGQAAKGVDQVVGQLRRNVRLFRSVMHSFSPLRFDPAKQISFAVPKSSQSHAQYPSAPLRKTCARLESLPCRTVWRFGTRMHTESTWRFWTMPRRTSLQSPAPFRRRNCAVAHQQTDANTTASASI